MDVLISFYLSFSVKMPYMTKCSDAGSLSQLNDLVMFQFSLSLALSLSLSLSLCVCVSLFPLLLLAPTGRWWSRIRWGR